MPTIKFQLANKNGNSRKLVSATGRLDGFPKLKDFSDEVGGDIYKRGVLRLSDEMGRHLHASMVNQYLPRKLGMGKRSMQGAGDTSGISVSCNQERKKFVEAVALPAATDLSETTPCLVLGQHGRIFRIP